MKKRVFSKALWQESMRRAGWTQEAIDSYAWPDVADGMTIEECTDYGLQIPYAWMKDIDVPTLKQVAWDDDYDYGTTIVNRSEARLAFGIQLGVARRHDKWHWSMGTEYDTIKKGSCVHMEKAKQSAEKAFLEYVQEEYAKCMEE